MRLPQVSFLRFTIVIAILGLVCSVPFQHRRDKGRAFCIFFARWHAQEAEQLTNLSDLPAAWMDEFRPEVRRRAARAMDESRRFSQSSEFNADEEERIALASAVEHEDQQFWARFDKAAAQNGFQRPKVGHRREGEIWSTTGFLVRSWLTYVLIALLFLTLRRCPGGPVQSHSRSRIGDLGEV